jgi:hypothetical protein
MELRVSLSLVVSIYKPWEVEGVNFKNVGVDHVMFV